MTSDTAVWGEQFGKFPENWMMIREKVPVYQIVCADTSFSYFHFQHLFWTVPRVNPFPLSREIFLKCIYFNIITTKNSSFSCQGIFFVFTMFNSKCDKTLSALYNIIISGSYFVKTKITKLFFYSLEAKLLDLTL